MSIVSKVGGAIKNTATNVSSKVSNAVSNIFSGSKTGNVVSTPTTISAPKTTTNLSSTPLTTNVGVASSVSRLTSGASSNSNSVTNKSISSSVPSSSSVDKALPSTVQNTQSKTTGAVVSAYNTNDYKSSITTGQAIKLSAQRLGKELLTPTYWSDTLSGQGGATQKDINALSPLGNKGTITWNKKITTLPTGENITTSSNFNIPVFAIENIKAIPALPVVTVAQGQQLMGKGFLNKQQSTGRRIGNVALGLGIGTVGLAGGVGVKNYNIEKSIVNEQLTNLEKQPFNYVARQSTSNPTDVTIKAWRSSGDVKQNLVIDGKSYSKGSGYIMPTSKATLTTSGKLDYNIMTGRTGTTISDIRTFEVGSKGISKQVGDTGSITFSKTGVYPKLESSQIYKSEDLISPKSRYGIIKNQLDNYKVSKSPTEITYSGTRTTQIKTSDNAFFSVSRRITSMDLGTGEITTAKSARGITFIKEPKINTEDSGIISFQGGGSKSSPSYFKSLYGGQVQAFETQTPKLAMTSTKSAFATGSSNMLKSFNIKPTSTGLVTKTESKQITTPSFKTDQGFKIKQSGGLIQIPKIITQNKSRNGFGTTAIVKTDTTQIQTPTQITTPKLITNTKTISGIIPIAFAGGGFGINNPSGKFPFALPKLRAGMDFGSGKSFKFNRKYSYTPSYKAIVFGIKTKSSTPSGSKKYTGFEVRGITKGFNWSNKIKGGIMK